ncbi:MAG: hypothetical protein EON54_06295 [Alcaligenaceae bacterium]|nr:MAG: hypothetical protein EON54_06295 [Alcaligenaceae bacterium]
MNIIRLKIKKIEKQILDLETEAAALLDRENSSRIQVKKINVPVSQPRNFKHSNIKAPNRVH